MYGNRKAFFLAIVAGLAAASSPAADIPIKPRVLRKLPVSAVAWLDGDTLLLGSREGIKAYSLKSEATRQIIRSEPIPQGLPYIDRLDTDGETVVAVGEPTTQLACRVRDGKRLFARSHSGFQVLDIAVWRNRMYVLGWPASRHGVENPSGAAVWVGAVTGNWDLLSPFHVIRSGPNAVALFNDAVSPYGGSVAVEPDGTVNVMTAAEPGVFRYAPSGRLLQVLGRELEELIVRRMHDINFTFGARPEERYRQIVNVQPMADGLVVTADGPAILVRMAEGNFIRWELWYPNSERLRRRVRLDVERAGPYGHMDCSARARRLACAYSMPKPQAATSSLPGSEVSYLALFDLPALTPDSSHARKLEGY